MPVFVTPSVTSDGLGWTLSVPVTRLAAAIDLFADVVLNPTLPPAAFETERSVALSQVAQLRDDMFRYPVRLATEAAFGSHPYGRGVLGSETTLTAIRVDDALAWHEAQVRRANAVLAVVGDVDPGDIAVRLERAFEALEWRSTPTLASPMWPDAFVQRSDVRDKAQTALAVAFPGPTRGDESRIAAHLIASVASGLGGRFFDELRDRQSLAYTVHATSNDRVAAGMFLSYIATSPEKEEAARHGLLREFARLCEDRVTDDEMARATTYALGTHAISQQSGANVLAELIDAYLYGNGIEELDAFEPRIRAVTPASMRELARTYFDPARRVEGVVRGR